MCEQPTITLKNLRTGQEEGGAVGCPNLKDFVRLNPAEGKKCEALGDDRQEELKKAILECIDSHGSPSIADLIRNCESIATEDEIKKAVRELCQDGQIRQKEDLQEHDWVYRRNRGN
jgi:hypothetical protein